MNEDLEVLDFNRGLTRAQQEKLVAVDAVPSELIDSAWKSFKGDGGKEVTNDEESIKSPLKHCTIYEHTDFPGTTARNFIMSSLTSSLS